MQGVGIRKDGIMAVILMYHVDRSLYNELEQNYPTVLNTTEYSCGGTALTHLQVGDNHGMRLNNMLSYQYNAGIEFQQFFIKKTRNHAKPKSIDRNTFESKLKSFNKSRTSVEREIVKEYSYINTIGEHDTVQIVLKSKGGSITAVIVFDTVEQCGAFVCPAWLEELSERTERLSRAAQAPLRTASGQEYSLV